MPEQKIIDEFLDHGYLAFVGVSRDPKQFANSVYRHLRDGGRQMYPVNRQAGGGKVEGDRSYPDLGAVPDPVDGVVIMVPGAEAADVVAEALDRGISRVWLHHGIGSGSDTADAVALCRAADVEVVDGACPFMFAEPVHGVHKLHRMMSGRRVAV